MRTLITPMLRLFGRLRASCAEVAGESLQGATYAQLGHPEEISFDFICLVYDVCLFTEMLGLSITPFMDQTVGNDSNFNRVKVFDNGLESCQSHLHEALPHTCS